MVDELITFFGSQTRRELVVSAVLEHVYLSLLPLLLGLVLAVPLGALAQRSRWGRGLVVNTASIFYTVPSLALFLVLPAVIGTQTTSPWNVVIALGLYTAALLTRPVIDALDAVPEATMAAATAMGFRRWWRFLTVQLPLAVPVLVSGVRVASVSNISLVSVGALLGIGGLGRLFTSGYQVQYITMIVVGILLTLVLALVIDLLLVAAGRLLTPWQRARRAPALGAAA